MKLRINGQERELPADSTVAALLGLLGLAKERVAIERNGAIVPRAVYDNTVLFGRRRAGNRPVRGGRVKMELGSWRAGELESKGPLARKTPARLGWFLLSLTFAFSIFAEAPESAEGCAKTARKILSDIRISFLAKEGEVYIHSARRSFAESPPGCASGLWYLAAARLLREPGQKAPLEGEASS